MATQAFEEQFQEHKKACPGSELTKDEFSAVKALEAQISGGTVEKGPSFLALEFKGADPAPVSPKQYLGSEFNS